MSIFETAEVACPGCKTPVTFDVATSVNGDRRPDLRLAIIDGSFQRVQCGSCSVVVEIPPVLTYLEVGRGHWILVKPASSFESWSVLEMIARETYARAFGAEAPAAAQSIGRKLRPRIVFGWPALNEKLLAVDKGIDDVELELLKLALLRNVSGAPLGDETELRLIEADDETLMLAWVNSHTGKRLTSLQVDRDNLAEIVANADAWNPLRVRLTEAFFVDVGRLLLVPAEPIDHIV